MKKHLTFIPLGIGISAGLIYIISVIRFRIIGDSTTLLQILSNLRIYLYVSIAGFLVYLFLRVLFLVNVKEKEVVKTKKEVVTEYHYDDKKIEPKYEYIEETKVETPKKVVVKETVVKEENSRYNKYCYNCGKELYKDDNYCRNCGCYQNNKKQKSSTLRFIINLIEIIIMILIIYFAIMYLLDYKQKNVTTFKSPFKITITK